MRHDAIDPKLRDFAFEFFYWFSRFEFALKENSYLKNNTIGAKAEPNWRQFVIDWQEGYLPSVAAQTLIEANPQRQIVGATGLEFRDVDFDDQPSPLGKVVRLAQTVRNNLFHGGKHGNDGWDSAKRMHVLLPTTITVLAELAEIAGLRGDYERYY